MKIKEVENIINKVYPMIAKDYQSTAKVEVYESLFTRLNCIPAEECNAYAEYDWNENKIYIYITNMKSIKDIICSLIHECVHSNQNKELFEAFYALDLDYSTHPYEIEANYEELKWKKYKLNTTSIG